MSDYQIGRDLQELQQRVYALEAEVRRQRRRCNCNLDTEVILPTQPETCVELECVQPIETSFSLADIGKPEPNVAPWSQVVLRPPMSANDVAEIARKISDGNLSWTSLAFASRPTGQIATAIGYSTQGGGEADSSIAHLEAGFQFKCRFPDRSGRLQIHTEWGYPNGLNMRFHLDDKSNFATDSGYGIRGIIGVRFLAWRSIDGTYQNIIDSWQPLVYGGLQRCYVGGNLPGNCDDDYNKSGLGPPFLGAKSDIVVDRNQEMTIEIWLISEVGFDSDDVTINGNLSATPTVNVIVADIVS